MRPCGEDGLVAPVAFLLRLVIHRHPREPLLPDLPDHAVPRPEVEVARDDSSLSASGLQVLKVLEGGPSVCFLPVGDTGS